MRRLGAGQVRPASKSEADTMCRQKASTRENIATLTNDVVKEDGHGVPQKLDMERSC
jgi:hypothetical protein